MAKRPVSAVGNRRPITEYAKMAAAMGGHMRYKVNRKRQHGKRSVIAPFRTIENAVRRQFYFLRFSLVECIYI